MHKSTGAILWRGPSLIDGAPIVAIATGLSRRSANRKTGAMIQTYILRADMRPTDAIRQGSDVSICGTCPHRGDGTGKARTCYVNVGQGPLTVYNAYARGAYPMAADIAEVARGRVVRLGTYGDPAAVPAHVWRALVTHASGHTGYTHRWREAPDLRGLCMASADSPADALAAQRQGWRTFRVDTAREPVVQVREVLCPASEQAGRKLKCATCLACAGANGRRASVYIPAHGGFAVMANVRRLQAA